VFETLPTLLCVRDHSILYFLEPVITENHYSLEIVCVCNPELFFRSYWNEPNCFILQTALLVYPSAVFKWFVGGNFQGCIRVHSFVT
jgi:hypothetical protein